MYENLFFGDCSDVTVSVTMHSFNKRARMFIDKNLHDKSEMCVFFVVWKKHEEINQDEFDIPDEMVRQYCRIISSCMERTSKKACVTERDNNCAAGRNTYPSSIDIEERVRNYFCFVTRKRGVRKELFSLLQLIAKGPF